jgi:putative transposase
MQLTYRYRLYPSRAQEQKLLATLDSCRWLYNHFLEQLNRKENGKTPRRYELQATLPNLKQEHPELKQVHSKVLQMVLHQLYSNLRALAELKRNGHKVGRLRFKGQGWFKSFTYNQSGFKIIEGHGKRRELWLSKISLIPIVLHRELDGEVKQVHVKRERSGKWFACFSVEVEDVPKVRKISKPVGIDLGITHYIADTDGSFVEHPHSIAKSEWRLKREQRRLSRKQKGSKNRAKQRIRLARAHERVCNQRLDFLHKLSHDYVSRHDFIATEDLGVKELIEMARNGKNRADAAWATFLHFLTYKAERAGGWVVKVEPRGTTNRCSRCGEVVEKPLWVRVHRCPRCGLELDRDINAARNILQDSLKRVGREPAEFTPVEIGPLSPSGTSSVVEAGSPILF